MVWLRRRNRYHSNRYQDYTFLSLKRGVTGMGFIHSEPLGVQQGTVLNILNTAWLDD